MGVQNTHSAHRLLCTELRYGAISKSHIQAQAQAQTQAQNRTRTQSQSQSSPPTHQVQTQASIPIRQETPPLSGTSTGASTDVSAGIPTGIPTGTSTGTSTDTSTRTGPPSPIHLKLTTLGHLSKRRCRSRGDRRDAAKDRREHHGNASAFLMCHSSLWGKRVSDILHPRTFTQR